MGTLKSLGSAAALLSMAILCGCSNELTSSSVIPVELGTVGVWPDTLLVGEDSVIEVRLTLPGNRTGLARAITWTSSNTSVASVQPLPPAPGGSGNGIASLRAVVTASGRGQADITVSIPDSLGFQAADTTLSVTVHEHWISIATGRDYACAVNTRHEAYCWGALGHGSVIGDGTATGSDQPVAVISPLPGKGFRTVSPSTDGIQYDDNGFNTFTGLTCGILDGPAAGLAYCWGIGSLVPTLIPGARAYTNVSIGGRRACANDSTISTSRRFDDPFRASAQCWDPASVATPVEIPLPGFALNAGINFVLNSVAAGHDHVCGIWAGGSVFCWGSGGAGQLGDGSGVSSDTPVEVQLPASVDKVVAGPDHTCALTTTGDIYCWGGNADGQVGVPSMPGQGDIILTPVQVNAGGVKFLDVAAGGSIPNGDVQHSAGQTCAVGSDHLAYCWGYNRYGELRIGNGIDDGCANGYVCADHPRPVQGGVLFTAISTSTTAPFAYGSTATFTCGLTIRGEIYCWGSNSDGQLGGASGTTPSRISEPQ